MNKSKQRKRLAVESARTNYLGSKIGNIKYLKPFEEIGVIVLSNPKKGTRNRKKFVPLKGRVKYRNYIKSKNWLRRRIEYFDKFGRKCVVCGEGKVHVHHMSYDNLGREKDEDLVLLCEFHHKLLHEELGKGSNLRQETSLFISRKQQEIQFKEIMKNI